MLHVMKKCLILTIILFTLGTFSFAQENIGIGKWRDHFSYQNIYQVISAENRVYGVAKKGLFYYDKEDYTINRVNKISELSDIGISTAAYDKRTKTLVVAYTNSNIDLVVHDNTYNISDIKRKDISGDKSIYHIRFHDKKAYLACGFGIVVIDLQRKEIQDVYYLGENGNNITITDVAFTDSLIVAGTKSGLRQAPKDHKFLNISTNWSIVTDPSIEGKHITALEVLNNQLIITENNANNTIHIYRQIDDKSFIKWRSGYINSIKVSSGKLLISDCNSVRIYNSNYQLTDSIISGDYWLNNIYAYDAEIENNALFIGNNWAGIIYFPNYKNKEAHSLMPSGPTSDNIFKIVSYQDRIYACPGGIQKFIPASMGIFQNNEWKNLSGNIKDTIWDITDVVVDPKDKDKLYASSWSSGIVEISNNTVQQLYNEQNSEGAIVRHSSGTVRIGCVAIDENKNLWYCNSLEPNVLGVRKADGSWKSFYTNNVIKESDIYRLMIDSMYSYKWFFGRENKIYIHNGVDKIAYINPNNGSKLETSQINCIVQDHNNEIWIGTDKGIKVIYNFSEAFSNGGHGEMSPISCNNILYSENGNVEYLLAYENITSIAVDGANRKWIGTASGGIFLISASGDEQLLHFSSANSPLISNKISCIGIQGESGEVFIGTDKGLVSYRGTATYANATPEETIQVFPNPVRPEYTGPIAIKGFTRDALVHITNASGHVIYSTQALGGQAVWYGKNHSGARVASGVYYVFASDKNGKNRSIGKVLFMK